MMLSVFTDASGSSASSPPQYSIFSGGIAYTNGIQAHFYNPANLMIRNYQQSTQVTLGFGGLYYSNGMKTRHVNRFPDHIQSHFLPEYLPHNTIGTESGLLHKFGDGDQYTQTQSYDMIPVGISWMRESSARSLAFRSRGVSSFEMNRNWYDSGAESEESFVRYVNQKNHVFHELSVGFSREVTMFNRWRSGLNTLLIGLAPKAVFGGMFSEINFHSEYFSNDGRWQNFKLLESRSSGDMNRFIADMAQIGDVSQAFHNHLNTRSNMEINGYGLGLDAGLTYIIPVGNDITLAPHIKAPLRKSLRFSIAISDIGMVLYQNQPGEWSSVNLSQDYDEFPLSNNEFDGYTGEIFRFLQDDPWESSALENLTESDDIPFFIQLPAELHIGTAFQYNWFVSMLDMNYRFIPTGYGTSGWRTTLGTEIRLLRFLPLQANIQLDPSRHVTFGFGAGLDFGFLHLSAATRLFYNDMYDNKSVWVTNSISTLGLQIRF